MKILISGLLLFVSASAFADSRCPAVYSCEPAGEGYFAGFGRGNQTLDKYGRLHHPRLQNCQIREQIYAFGYCMDKPNR